MTVTRRNDLPTYMRYGLQRASNDLISCLVERGGTLCSVPVPQPYENCAAGGGTTAIPRKTKSVARVVVAQQRWEIMDDSLWTRGVTFLDDVRIPSHIER
jgi:hypothetical protein